MSHNHSDHMSQRSKVSKIALWMCSLNVFVFFIVFFFVFVFSFFFGHVMSPHHSDQISRRSQVSRIALWRCSLNAFVCVIVFVFVFVIVFFWVRSCLLITLIKCLKGHKAPGSLCMSKSKTSLSVVSDRGRYRAVSDSVWTAKKRGRFEGLFDQCTHFWE